MRAEAGGADARIRTSTPSLEGKRAAATPRPRSRPLTSPTSVIVRRRAPVRCSAPGAPQRTSSALAPSTGSADAGWVRQGRPVVVHGRPEQAVVQGGAPSIHDAHSRLTGRTMQITPRTTAVRKPTRPPPPACHPQAHHLLPGRAAGDGPRDRQARRTDDDVGAEDELADGCGKEKPRVWRTNSVAHQLAYVATRTPTTTARSTPAESRRLTMPPDDPGGSGPRPGRWTPGPQGGRCARRRTSRQRPSAPRRRCPRSRSTSRSTARSASMLCMRTLRTVSEARDLLDSRMSS